MTEIEGLKQVGYLDCPGGGQVRVVNGFAYIGHIDAPDGTTIIDVSDPKDPAQVAKLDVPKGLHSHKVRVNDNGLMLINRELHGAKEAPLGYQGGLGIYDISDPRNPRELPPWECGGKGVHRFDFDGRYAYISPTIEGYVGNIMMILDMADPEKPEEVGRWWMEGQWIAGGETPTWKDTDHRCHHPLRMGDRLYVSYWQGGFVILDISDMSQPKRISGLDWSPPFVWPTHTALPIPFDVQGRRILVVADEDVLPMEPFPGASFLWIVDITDETHPMPFASFQVEGIEPVPNPTMTGCHQPCEIVTGTEIPVAWFAQGLRVIDIANPHSPREVARFVPPVPEGSARVSSNDVTVDENGLIYLMDRKRGLHILERT